MNFITFNDFLNCVYVHPQEIKARPSPDEVLESLMMIYAGEPPSLDGQVSENNARKTVQGLKMIGAVVVKVVHRCRDARDSAELDLSSCSLLHLPAGVLHLMKHFNITKCNLSDNLLSRLSTTFGSCFSSLTNLDLSFNNMSVLPKEILLCKSLSSVDISTNSFVMFPYLLLELKDLTEVKANNNFIAEIDEESLESHESLEEIHLVGNPLNQTSHDKLSKILSLRIFLSPRNLEDWEDLSI